MEFSKPEDELFPSPGDLPNPGIEPRSPALQADSLPAEPRGKPLGSQKRECWQTYIFIDSWATANDLVLVWPMAKGQFSHIR